MAEEGAVAFNKNALSLGPAGGDGGSGGSIYFEGVSDLSALKQFRYKKNLKQKMGSRENRNLMTVPMELTWY